MDQNPKILIVDDEENIRWVFKKALGKKDFLVDTAANGEDALTKIQSNDYLIVFTDIFMEGMTGLELLSRVKDTNPNIKIVVMTAQDTMNNTIEAMRLGAYDYISKPFDFDETKSYPIVAYVYPGPQTESVAKSFSTSRYETALAQFGMIVITVGNRGGHPARSKWYHNYGYGNLRDYGLADKKTAIEQLADRHAFIDIDRVGIYGHSGGGFMSTAAMLVYPDFFKVAVSSSGNHNNDVYNLNWSEKHDGVKEVVDDSGAVTFEYDIDKNSDPAAHLKGHLLLTTGDIDNNVHPTNTLRIAEALIKANKRFDFFMFPGQRHGYGDMGDYWFWLRAEYFVKHLLHDYRWSANIAELDVEHEQSR